jgi:hypothetical protein
MDNGLQPRVATVHDYADDPAYGDEAQEERSQSKG